MSRGIFGELFRIEDIETHLKEQSGGSLPDCLYLSAASMSGSLPDLHIALNTAECLPFRVFSDGVLVFEIRGLLRFRLRYGFAAFTIACLGLFFFKIHQTLGE